MQMILPPRHTVKVGCGPGGSGVNRRSRRASGALIALLAVAGLAPSAAAHTTERGIVLLLPTVYWVWGGTVAVGVSFLVMAAVPARLIRCLGSWRVDLCSLPRLPGIAVSGLTFVLLVGLILAGLIGSRDPLSNPLPLTVWTLWWVGLTTAQALFGDLWAVLNPWRAPHTLLSRLAGTRDDAPPLSYPQWLGYWPAVAGLFGFAWFELIDLAPDDPARLAVAVAVYSAATLVGMLLFGASAWLGRAECFSVLFGLIARIAPFQLVTDPAAPRRRKLVLAFPAAGLARAAPLPVSGVLFVLLSLATVSFDGLSKTFWYLDQIGINPLEFPGRSAVAAANTMGLFAMWVALAAAYGLAVSLGGRLAGDHQQTPSLFGSLVLSILPISIGYHFAHYLTVFLIGAQYALLALADPFHWGWWPEGQQQHVTVAFQTDFSLVSIIWKLQAAGVVAGHVLAVLVAHAIAVERRGGTRRALLSQLPLALLMIGYTLFGLWLLAAPTAG